MSSAVKVLNPVNLIKSPLVNPIAAVKQTIANPLGAILPGSSLVTGKSDIVSNITDSVGITSVAQKEAEAAAAPAPTAAPAPSDPVGGAPSTVGANEDQVNRGRRAGALNEEAEQRVGGGGGVVGLAGQGQRGRTRRARTGGASRRLA